MGKQSTHQGCIKWVVTVYLWLCSSPSASLFNDAYSSGLALLRLSKTLTVNVGYHFTKAITQHVNLRNYLLTLKRTLPLNVKTACTININSLIKQLLI